MTVKNPHIEISGFPIRIKILRPKDLKNLKTPK